MSLVTAFIHVLPIKQTLQLTKTTTTTALLLFFLLISLSFVANDLARKCIGTVEKVFGTPDLVPEYQLMQICSK
jgi:hypothetical protein